MTDTKPETEAVPAVVEETETETETAAEAAAPVADAAVEEAPAATEEPAADAATVEAETPAPAAEEPAAAAAAAADAAEETPATEESAPAAEEAAEAGEAAAEEAGEEKAEEEEEPKKESKWGKWGEDPDEHLMSMAETEKVDRSNNLLDDLAVEDPNSPEHREEITGPDGYKYPPLTKRGIEILKRMWSGEMPENRQESVKLWEGKVRVAVNVGLAIPVPPFVPAQELLDRPAAAFAKANEEKDLSRWVMPAEAEEVRPEELKEFDDKGIVAETVTKLLDKRMGLRSQRSFREADEIRDILFEMGVEFNDMALQWRAEGGKFEGSFGKNMVGGAAAMMGGDGGNTQEDRSRRPPPEVMDIDMPGSWEDFLSLPEPKVLAVGPRAHHNGKRAWGAGGANWGVTDQQQAVEQAMNNCTNQGVHRPKVIWPLHLATGPQGGGGKGGGYGKGGGKYGGGKGGKSNGYNNNRY